MTVVDLTQPAEARWNLSGGQTMHARNLLISYQRDLGLPAALVTAIARPIVRAGYWAEMESIAKQVEMPVEDVVCGNLYYDALKAVLVGCTAFAVDTPSGPLHARNLDWWAENDILRRYTETTRFTGAPAGEFTTVGWPGFVGVFSGVAPGRFAVTLNAVISDEPLQAASPVVFLLRRALEEAPDFQAALSMLRDTPLASDSLLLLTGVRSGEMAVIERTPTRAEVRYGENGRLFVTNDYRVMRTGLQRPGSALQATACGRFDRIRELVTARAPEEAEACLEYLSDDGVRMTITMQQMVFQAATGLAVVR